MNSLPTWFYWENSCLQILHNTVTLNSYLGLSVLSKFVFGLYINLTREATLNLPKHFERTANIRSNLKFGCFQENQTNTEWGHKVFLQLGRICFRILLRQSKFCLNSLFATWSYCYLNPKHVIQHALKLLSISHTFYEVTNFYKIFPLLPIVIIAKSP